MAVSKIKQVLLTLAIVIVLSFFVFYSIEVFFPSPQWDDYCDERTRAPKLIGDIQDNQESCIANGGTWTPQAPTFVDLIGL